MIEEDLQSPAETPGEEGMAALPAEQVELEVVADVPAEVEPEAAADVVAELVEPEAAADAVAELVEPIGESPVVPEIPVEPAADQAGVAAVSMAVPWWPFLVELGVWVAYVGASAWQLSQVPTKAPMLASAVYPFTLLGGLVLTAAGPALILAVWVAQLGAHDGRGARFVSALVKGSVITLAGAAMWWGTLAALDFVRLGRLF